MTKSSTFSSNLPTKPAVLLETIDHMSLFKLVRAAQNDRGTMGIAAGHSLDPDFIIKHKSNGDSEVRYSRMFSSVTVQIKTVDMLLDNWPTKFEPYDDQYLWFNSMCECVSPLFDARANIIGRPIQALQALCEIWSETDKPRAAVIWDSEGVARRIDIHLLPTMMLGTFSIKKVREVLTKFSVLGQGFLRYCVYQSSYSSDEMGTGLVQLVNAVSKLKSFPVYGTTNFLRELAHEDSIWMTTK